MGDCLSERNSANYGGLFFSRWKCRITQNVRVQQYLYATVTSYLHIFTLSIFTSFVKQLELSLFILGDKSDLTVPSHPPLHTKLFLYAVLYDAISDNMSKHLKCLSQLWINTSLSMFVITSSISRASTVWEVPLKTDSKYCHNIQRLTDRWNYPLESVFLVSNFHYVVCELHHIHVTGLWYQCWVW